MSKLSISYLLALMIVFQSFLAIADIHSVDNDAAFFHQESIHQTDDLEQTPAEFKEQDLVNEITTENTPENHVECHHGHCHHASVVFMVKDNTVALLNRQNDLLRSIKLSFTPPHLSPDLRPPIL